MHGSTGAREHRSTVAREHGSTGGGRGGDLALGGGRGVPWPGSVIPDFTLPDTLEKNFVRDLASNFSK